MYLYAGGQRGTVLALVEWRGRRRRENVRRRRAGSKGFAGLLLLRFAAGADEAVGEKPLERVFAP